MWRWFVDWRQRREKSVMAWSAISRTPDENALFYPDGHDLAGRSRRARISRFPERDRTKLDITRHKPRVVTSAGAGERWRSR